MNWTQALTSHLGTWGQGSDRGGWKRILVLVLLGALVVPLLLSTFAPAAHADEENPDNYSLYQLASNASTYFSEQNSPEVDGTADERMPNGWQNVTRSAASAGSLLGYADPEFSLGNIVGWFFAEVSGSSQTVMYSTLEAQGGNTGETNLYAGLMDYAHFGAANSDLGLDSMSSGIGGQIMSAIGGQIMWVLYALALAVGTLFYLIIQLLKLINPFGWFYLAVSQTADSSGNTNSAHQQDLADGMTGGGGAGGFLESLQVWISGWYGLLQSIAWEALVPLFIGFTIIGLVLFKKMDRGSALKKLIVRIVFIGVGLPLVGSMYTGVLDKFDDSLLGQHSGPTRVVLSTYVDFEAWAMNDRLAVPDDATIGWAGDQATSEAMMSVRRSALAINVQSHGDIFADISTGNQISDAESAWKDGTVNSSTSASDDVNAVFTTFGILGKYIASGTTAASDFESGIKSSITNLSVGTDAKKDWFVNDKSYGDVERFGDEDGPSPDTHPVIAVTEGLVSSNPGSKNTTFTTVSGANCGFTVTENGGSQSPSACNLAPLAMYNYLNTGFNAESLTMYSSNNATSGFTRESHMTVSQVGTGPAKFMYWHNAATVLGSIVLLGFWYAIGMLVGSIKRTFSLVAAIPFATLGAMAAIAKVIVYTAALILEVIVTLFIYQFVSEFLISIPDIIAGPISSLMSPDGLFGSAVLGGIVVVILTLISSLLVMGVTFALLKVRKVVLQAMDEVFTKLVDKFLETNTPPKPDKGGGIMPALASGAGAGAGMALGSKVASGLGNKMGGGGSKLPGKTGSGGGQQGSTNAGGLNAEKAQLGGGGNLALEAGERPGGAGPDGAPGGDGDGGGSLAGGGGNAGGGGARAIEAGAPGAPGDKGGPLQLGGSPRSGSLSDKQTAQALSSRGGLSNLGFEGGKSGSGTGSHGEAGGQTHFGVGGAPVGQAGSGQDGQKGGSGQNGSTTQGGAGGRGHSGNGRDGADAASAGASGSDGATSGSASGARTGKSVAGQSASTQFGSGQGAQPGQAQPAAQGTHFTAGPSGVVAPVAGAGRSSGTGAGPTVAGGVTPSAPQSNAGRSAKAQQGARPVGQAGTGQQPGVSTGAPAQQRPVQRPGVVGASATSATPGAPSTPSTPVTPGAPATRSSVRQTQPAGPSRPSQPQVVGQVPSGAQQRPAQQGPVAQQPAQQRPAAQSTKGGSTVPGRVSSAEQVPVTGKSNGISRRSGQARTTTEGQTPTPTGRVAPPQRAAAPAQRPAPAPAPRSQPQGQRPPVQAPSANPTAPAAGQGTPRKAQQEPRQPSRNAAPREPQPGSQKPSSQSRRSRRDQGKRPRRKD